MLPGGSFRSRSVRCGRQGIDEYSWGAEAREVGADCGGTNGSRPDADSIKNGELADRAQMILAGHFARATGRGRSGPTRDERSVVRGERIPTCDAAVRRRCGTSAGPEDPVR